MHTLFNALLTRRDPMRSQGYNPLSGRNGDVLEWFNGCWLPNRTDGIERIQETPGNVTIANVAHPILE